ncbi:crotonobetainyl-CoA:carnitine CoA-transferase CaiB-like acyl-CoA transferase [Duganella sp. 1224]|uniref:CoA transferase n=1 Tax=Duganella sp. 1224 TaxID=2587052 RepID=UPI0015C6B8C7|nr:CoA transferase [Duganella sp. 1224]NYE60852.1 crotonobetainyl-CoA:carnitine CoA-transferase CaiB-like acyl-CoA transferase [Duganella sp. 1224]
MLNTVWSALGLPVGALNALTVTGEGALPSYFDVTGLAAASVGAATLAVRELMLAQGAAPGPVTVDRRLASMWFSWSICPVGWERPPLWDAVAGDYPTADGWIRLHTNAPHHRRAALAVLGCAEEREAVARAVAGWRGLALEEAVVAQGGCAAVMRSLVEWQAHAQGQSVASEPLMAFADAADVGARRGWGWAAVRPLAGLKVLDLTRVLAGPVATRFLAGYGADVLRIDPPGWNEPGVIPEVTLGKRCARLDLTRTADRAIFTGLLAEADVLVHGYRPQALERLGLGEAMRRRLNPHLIDIALDAYGWTGPLAGRRGFDSLVQMSCGIAHHGMQMRGADKPVPLPVQALDHATGYLLAAAAIRALIARLTEGRALQARLSLARTATLLTDASAQPSATLAPATEDDFAARLEQTEWGPARRYRPPAAIDGAAMAWDHPASSLGSSSARWGAD